LGGVGIFGSFLLAFLIVSSHTALQSEEGILRDQALWAAGLGSLLMFATGLLDDFRNLRARYKLLLQILAALVAMAGGLSFGPFLTPFGFTLKIPLLSWLITLVWVVGVTNAVNLIDGMDGLAGGVSAIAALFWILIALASNDHGPAFLILPAALLGAILGFLLYNKPKARIFMGDTGSLVLGYVLSLFPLFRVEGVSSTRWLLVGITLLVVPIFDTLAAILRRLRECRSIGDPDRHHIHHKFLDLGFRVPQILGIVYFFSALSGLIAYLWIRHLKSLPSYYLPLAWIPTVALFLVLHFKTRRTKGPEPERAMEK
jgi:UDP-GlcNAc:undecaprenyl-phosphate GlcNAc-1-phosphate transferase